MPVIFTILKVLLALLAVLLLLLAVAMLLPLGFSVEYRRGRVRVSAVYGPLRRTLWSHRAAKRAAYTGGRPAVTAADGSSAGPPPQGPPQQPGPSAEAGETEPPRKAPPGPAEPPAGEQEDLQEPPAGAAGRMERMLVLMEEDPRALLNCLWEHMQWLHRHSFFKLWVRHLNVFWTVTCEEASQTAVAYGAALAALNTLLPLVRQKIHLQSDRLRLEPDFTGQWREQREISFTVSACAVLMLHLLYRIWKDPLLQPEPQPEPQTV